MGEGGIGGEVCPRCLADVQDLSHYFFGGECCQIGEFIDFIQYCVTNTIWRFVLPIVSSMLGDRELGRSL